MVGKRAGRPVAQLATASPPGARLIFLRDDITGKDFLADSGAALSVYTHSSQSPPSPTALIAANGAAIASWGSRRLQVRFQGTTC